MEDRKSFIGSSEIATVLGINPFQTPLELWAIKTGNIPAKDLSENEAVEWGVRLEDIVAQKFSEKNNVKLIAYKKRFVHPEYPFLSCELDRLIAGTEELLEVKTCSLWNYKDWKDADDIPIYYIAQVMFALGLSGRKVGHIAVLVGGQKYLEKKIIFDEKTFNKMVEKAVKFWNDFIITNQMPFQISAKDNDTLYQLFPNATEGEPLELGDEANMIIESLEGMTADFMDLKDKIEQQKNELKALLKEKEMGITNRYKVTWKEQEKKEYVVKASKSRVLRYSKINKEE